MFGISDQASWPALRVGAPFPSQLSPLYVGGRISDLPGAASMQVTVIDPTGIARPPVVCGETPCAVMVDRQMGNPTIQVSYLDSTGNVLAQGQPFTVGVN